MKTFGGMEYKPMFSLPPHPFVVIRQLHAAAALAKEKAKSTN
jgi:hypothetical protein